MASSREGKKFTETVLLSQYLDFNVFNSLFLITKIHAVDGFSVQEKKHSENNLSRFSVFFFKVENYHFNLNQHNLSINSLPGSSP